MNSDPTSGYYIHPSNASSTQLVSVKFNGNGFNNWKRSMLLVLSAKNKIGFVNGVIPKPDLTTAEFVYWSRCNDLVISWILFNLDDTIAKSVQFLSTAREIWLGLEERYGYASNTQVYSLEQKLADITQGSQTVFEFFTAIKTLCDGITDSYPLPYCTCNQCTCNLSQKIQDRQQDQRLLQFMMELNENYAAVRANILMRQPLPSLAAAYRLFAQEESHKTISQSSTQAESLAFLTDRKRFPDTNLKNNDVSGKANNNTGNRTFNKNKLGSNYYCTNCKVPGHSIDRCFKIHGFPANFRPKDNRFAALIQNTHTDDATQEDLPATDNQSNAFSQEQYSQLLDLLGKQHVVENETGDITAPNQSSHTALLTGKACLISCIEYNWIIDSGATDHITNSLSDFVTYTPLYYNS